MNCRPQNLGFGPKALEHKKNLEDMGIKITQYKEPSTKTRASYINWCSNIIRPAIDIQIETQKQNIRNSHKTEMLSTVASNKAKYVAVNLNRCKIGLQQMIADGNFPNHEVATKILPTLKDGYGIVKNNSSQIKFQTSEDQAYYTTTETTKSASLNSVFDVWKDFLKGRYKGRGFFFWVLVSILVDVAAFLFFDLAFKKEDF